MKVSSFNAAPVPIKEFLNYMQNVKGKSPRTIDEYYLDLRTFFRYIENLNILPLQTQPI